MDTLDPIHVAVLVHTLVERAIAQNTLDGGHLEPLTGTGLVTSLFQQLGGSQHGGSLLLLCEDEADNFSFGFINGQDTIDHLVAVGSAPAAITTARSLDATTFTGTECNVLTLLLCHELKQRTVDVGEIAALAELLLGANELDVLLFQNIQVVEVELGVTGHTIILEDDDGFVGRITHIVTVQDFIQSGTIILSTTGSIDLPVNDIIAMLVSIKEDGNFLSFDTELVIFSLTLRGNSDVADGVFECHHCYHLLHIR